MVWVRVRDRVVVRVIELGLGQGLELDLVKGGCTNMMQMFVHRDHNGRTTPAAHHGRSVVEGRER